MSASSISFMAALAEEHLGGVYSVGTINFALPGEQRHGLGQGDSQT